MKNLAIITARGGSKRIPKKNIKDFCGKPIIAYSIEAAIKSGIFDEVMVSTDSIEIADIAKRYGASVPFMRSAKSASDTAITNDVLFEVLNMYENRGMTFENYCCIYPTAPFLTSERLNHAYHYFLSNNASMLDPIVKFSFPPQRGMIIENGELKYKFPENALMRSQDLEPIYHECGQFYFFTNDAYDINGNRVRVTPYDIDPLSVDIYDAKGNRKKTVAYIMPEMEIQDIDTIEDWQIAEIKYRIINEIK